ncbi:MAG: TRAP transporter substrate-binding protein [Acetobacteraceae bacterium]|nr:TRAP transporter substrate-binding protein [Acetobacteraceae bacterium]
MTDPRKPLSRRLAWQAAGVALTAPMISRYARASGITWRIGHVAPVDTPLHRYLVEAAESISKRSDGRMELVVVPEGKAGIQSGLLAQVRNGGIEMTVTTCTQLAPTLAACSIPSIGFLFGDHSRLWPAMDGELGQLIRGQIATQQGLEVLEKIWDFGFRQITTSSRPIRTAADLSGLKIRTQVDADQMDMFRSLNTVPVVITLSYLRKALEHHQIDGQEGMLPVVEYARLSEVQTHCAMTNHVWDGLWLCANPTAWKQLPERLQRIVANTLNGFAPRQRADSLKMETSLRESLTKGGMTFTDVDQASFRDLLRSQGYYARIKAKFGEQTWNVMQKTTGITI